MSKTEFVQEFGSIYEHSQWMAERVWSENLTPENNKEESLTNCFNSLFLCQDRDKQLAVINAHPDLAGKLAIENGLTKASSNEQQAAGLDKCNANEFEKFSQYNQQYKDKFSFPFIKAVKGQTRQTILDDFANRLNNSYEQEFLTALDEINKIAGFRLQDWFVKNHYTNLASERAGARVLYATDDFFAAKERLISDHDAVFIDGKYDEHGKWMDGWESRRKRETGHDYCVIKLSQQGQIHSIEIDTAFFTGNYAPCASVDASTEAFESQDKLGKWTQILAATSLQGDNNHSYDISDDSIYSHLRLNIYPDGGVARLRVLGLPDE